jgi:hypothetical protein
LVASDCSMQGLHADVTRSSPAISLFSQGLCLHFRNSQ